MIPGSASKAMSRWMAALRSVGRLLLVLCHSPGHNLCKLVDNRHDERHVFEPVQRQLAHGDTELTSLLLQHAVTTAASPQ